MYSSHDPWLVLKTSTELRFLLLLLCISGFKAQEFDAVERRVEGQSLVVKCGYSAQNYNATRKTWCQVRGENCLHIVSTYYTLSGRYQTKVTSGRATIEDDTRNGIVTITMEKLQVLDSGLYSCAHYYPSNTVYPLKTIKLDVCKEFQEYNVMEGQNLSVQCPYNTQDYKEEKKAWCRSTTRNKCDVLVNTDHGYFTYHNRAQKGRASIHDDTQKEIVTITMEKLQVDDAGVYWCARYRPPNTYRIIAVNLTVTKEFQYNVMEGQNLSVQCPYNTQDYKEEKKAWCQSTTRNKCDVLVNTEHGYFTYHNRAQKGRTRIHDDPQKGIVTITMEKLQVDDAGVYWCALYRPPNIYRIIEVNLTVTKGTTTTDVPVTSTTGHISLVLNTANAGVTPTESSSLNSRSTFLWLGFGFLTNKTLVAVMIALLVRRRNRLGRSPQTPINLELMVRKNSLSLKTKLSVIWAHKEAGNSSRDLVYAAR